MKKESKNENLSICRECGGMCCKKSGCDYSALDFKNCTYDNLYKELIKGDKSIVCYMKFKKDNNGNYLYEPFLYLCARNKKRDIVDLVSIKTGCALLLSNGCSFSYKDRPSGGKNLKPVRKEVGPCVPLVNPFDIVGSWKNHQKTLKRLVLAFSGMNLEKRISYEVEKFFCEVLNEDFEGVSKLELKDIKGFSILLAKTFPEELENARKRCEKSKSLIRK